MHILDGVSAKFRVIEVTQILEVSHLNNEISTFLVVLAGMVFHQFGVYHPFHEDNLLEVAAP